MPASKAIALYKPAEALLAADARNNLAFLLTARRGAGEEALRLIREAISVRGERAAYLDTLGRACDAVDNKDCAQEAYSKLLSAHASEVPVDVLRYATERLNSLR